ncbi:hypothetical protein FHY55_10890 [Oceanicola sp. D3]|uniref:hypothetical protein n=1 Tax=Oceanicola sp. D3 TaxID=2587163 RepID=UPI00111CCB6F|nr:hypothetical protein [Oceanicola sp. D3]QDC09720.1 hypothetical protein FHY55_10890 [Oceanicola sp. D3]
MIRPTLLITLLSAVLAIALPASGQDVIGRALVEGKMVEILDNQTWRYADSGQTTPGCKQIHRAASFCGDPATWQATTPSTPDVAAAWRHDDRHYAQFIIEGFGSKDGLTREQMRKIVIDNAAFATNQPASSIPTLLVEPATIDGQEAETIVYMVDFDGLKAVFANTILIREALVVQAITYAISPDYSEDHMALHADLLESTRLD